MHDYLGGGRVELMPIRTYLKGLCYKLKFLKPKSFDMLSFFISSSISNGTDKLEKVNVLIGTNNTWQGIIGNAWPYNKDPLQVSGHLSTKSITTQQIFLKENIYISRIGEIDFDKCMNEYQDSQTCTSIFDPRQNTNQ